MADWLKKLRGIRIGGEVPKAVTPVLDRTSEGKPTKYQVGKMRAFADGLEPHLREAYYQKVLHSVDIPEQVKEHLHFLLGRHYVEQGKPDFAMDSFIRSGGLEEGARILGRAGFHKQAAQLHERTAEFHEAARHYREAGFEKQAKEMLRLAEETKRRSSGR
ncbi:hypothetical protein H0O03_03585 [Candidatus Micrarchaeota archaeon]|nr:hypothetical protein [Candidatus Micrarchaeota archaeon]